jgi:hypothetical protein
MESVFETRVITNPDGSWTTEQISVTWVEVSHDGRTITQTWESGFMIISSTTGYTESHLVHVVAFDAAGNETESEKVRFYVVHKPKEKEENEGETGAIWWRDDQASARSQSRSVVGLWRFLILPQPRPRPWQGYG